MKTLLNTINETIYNLYFKEGDYVKKLTS